MILGSTLATTRQVNINIGLMGGNRVRFVLPRHRWVGHDDGQVWEVSGDFIQTAAGSVSSLMPAPPGSRTHSVLTGVRQDRQTDFFWCFPQWVELAVRRSKPCTEGWVKPRTPARELGVCFFDGGFPLRGSTEAKWQQHVIIAQCSGNDDRQ